MEKVFNNQAELSRRLDSKTGRFAIEMPDFYKDEKGNYIVKDEQVVINSLEGFNEYISKHQEIIGFLGESYPKLVSKIYKNTLTSLADPSNRTSYSKILTGLPVKNSVVYQTAYAGDPLSVFKGFIKTYNNKNIGYECEDSPLPKVKRTSKQFLKQFKESKQGFLVPEIDKNGLVVNATNCKDDFSVKFIAVPDVDVSFSQLFNYFAAPFGGLFGESDAEFLIAKKLCAEAYASIGSEEMAKKVQEIVNYCISTYPISFVNIKPDKVKSESVPGVIPESEFEPITRSEFEFEPITKTETEFEPITKTETEFEPITKPRLDFEEIFKPKSEPLTKPRSEAEVEKFEVVFTPQFSGVPTSLIKDIKGNFKYHSSIQKFSFTEEIKKVEREF